ncbi:hypothetical protein CY652_22860 [Burkholderia sp. WAC0059]|nr:hypothetical protein CY652_22860 [Burkholderia sp. WAC0059]
MGPAPAADSTGQCNTITVSDGIIGKISAASAEQGAGIKEINRAVTQMDACTQQNAVLVEEATAAAQSLDDQVNALWLLIGKFRSAGD